MAVNLFDLYAKISLDDTQFNAGIGKALASGNTLAAKIGSVFTGISNVGKTAFKAIGVATTAGAAALGGFMKTSVDSGAEFDAAMSKVSAISGSTGDDLLVLRNKALEMGEKTKFTSTEAAEAFNYMAMAGWKNEDMLNSIEGVMNLAAASGEDLATTSDIVTDAMTAFGIAADGSTNGVSNATHFSDVLAASAANSNTNVGMLGESFKYIGSVAGGMQYSIEDIAIALGLMANNGVKASQGGTALRNILTNMTNPTKTMKTAMDVLGVSLTDADGNMLSFVDIMKQLRENFNNGSIESRKLYVEQTKLADQLAKGTISTEEYDQAMDGLAERIFNAAGANKAQYAAMLAGKHGMAGLLAIVNSSDEDFEKLTNAIYNCDGACEDMANTMLDNLAGDITYFNSALDILRINISDSVTPALRQFVQFGTESVKQVREAFSSGGWEAAINVVSQVLAQMLNQFIAFIPHIATMATQFVSTFVSSIGSNIGSITTAANQILQAFTSGFNQIMTQLMPIISQLVPTIANYIMTYKTQMFTLGLQIITAIAQGIANNIGTMITSAQGIIQNFVGAISQYAPQLISAAGQIIIALGNGIAQALPRLVQYAGQLIATLANGISTAIPKLIPVIQSIIDSIGKSLGDTSTISKITSAAANLIMTLAEGLSKAMPNIFNAAVNIISGLLRGLTSGDSLGKIISAGLKLIESLNKGVWDSIPKLIPVAADIVGRLVGTLVAKLPEILLTGVKMLQNVINGIIKAIPELVAAVPRIILGFVSGLTANLGTVVKEGIQLIVKLAAGVVEGIVHLVATAPKIVISLVKAIIQLVPELGKAGLELIKGLWEGIKGAGAWLWDKVKGFFGGIVDKIKGFLGIHSPSTLFAGFGRNMALGLGEGWDDEYDRIKDDIQSGLDFEPTNISNNGSYGRIGTSNMGTASDSSDTETVTEYNMQVTINLNGSDYTSQRQIAEEISVQLQNLVNRRSAAWA